MRFGDIIPIPLNPELDPSEQRRQPQSVPPSPPEPVPRVLVIGGIHVTIRFKLNPGLF